MLTTIKASSKKFTERNHQARQYYPQEIVPQIKYNPLVLSQMIKHD